jgi:hypothetical protein
LVDLGLSPGERDDFHDVFPKSAWLVDTEGILHAFEVICLQSLALGNRKGVTLRKL